MRAGAHYRSVSRGEWQRGVAGIAEQIPLCLGPHTRLDLRMAYFSLLARFAPERFKWLLLNIEREDLTAIGNFFSRKERQKTSARSEVRDLHRAINIHRLYG